MKNIYMYTLSTCPWCRKTKRYFTEHDVDFDFIDYDLADEATQESIIRELDAAGASGFPFVRIGNEIVEGYRPDRYAELLGV
jgi:glutaredoxin